MPQNIDKKDIIYQQLKEDIKSGKYPPESRLPTEIVFAKQLGVARVTLRSALERLLSNGMIQRIPRKGTFITPYNTKKRFLVIYKAESNISNVVQYVLPGIQKRLTEFNMELETSPLEFIRNLDANKAQSLFRDQKFAGIFLISGKYNGNEPEIKILEASGIPVIMPRAHSQDRNSTNFALITTDTRLAFGDGVRYLADQGHRRIATIIGNTCYNPYDDCRGFSTDEYMDFLSLNGLDSSPELLKATGYSADNIFIAVKELMLGPKPPTAITCYSDFYAIHVYNALKELRIKIPEQVSVMGYCGYPGRQFMSPPLTTVDLMYEDIGKMAVDLMLKSDEWFGKSDPITLFTPHRIAEGKSTQPVQKKEYAIA